MCLRVNGPLRAMKCPSSKPVSTMVFTPFFSLPGCCPGCPHSAGVGQLGAAQVDLVVRHHPGELEDLLPAGDASVWSTLKGLVGEAGVGELLAQLQVVQDERLPS